MVKENVDLLIIESPTDLYYLTGLKLSKGRALIHKKKSMLAVDGRYRDAAKKGSPFKVVELTDKKMLELFETSDFRQVRVVGFDKDAFSYADYLSLKQLLSASKKRRKLTTSFKLKGLASPVGKLRMIKDSHEIALIEKSAQLLWKGFSFIQKELREKVSEKEIAFAFETYCKKQGAEKLSFDPIIAFGSHTASPHHVTGERRLKLGELVLIDIGVVVNGYASDMTRMIFFGDVPKQLRELFSIVKKAQEAALASCGPGVKGKVLDEAARQVMADAGLEKHYLHSLGHGIGLNVHEPPRLSIAHPNVVLEEGMVVSIEPGLYLSGVGGARYEDMVVITKSGYRNLFPQNSP